METYDYGPPMFLTVTFLYCAPNSHLILRSQSFFFLKELHILSSIVLLCLP